MNKYYYLTIILFYYLVIHLNICAQTSTNSTYSMYGIGDLETNDYGKLGSMGNTGIALKSQHYLNQINPASLSGLDSLSFIYDFSAMGSITHATQNGAYYENIFTGNFKRLAIGCRLFPWWATSVGVSPYSMVGYQIDQTNPVNGINQDYIIDYQGSGGLNQFYWANSFKLTKNLSVGFNSAFIFGTVDQNEVIIGSAFDQVNSYTTTNYKGFYFNYGLQYAFNINEHFEGIIGGVFGNKQYLNYTENLLIQDLTMRDTVINETLGTGSFAIPLFYGVGLSLCRNKEFTWAVDYKHQRWNIVSISSGAGSMINSTSNLGSPFSNTASLENTNTLSFGFEYAPNKRIPKNYLDLMKYRFGLSYNETYLQIYDTPIKDYCMTMGFGMPASRSASLNVGFEVGRRGTIDNNLIQEFYYMMKVNITFDDAWFIRSRYQ